jgi:hypothetical protein
MGRLENNATNNFSMVRGTVAREIAEIMANEIARIGQIASAELMNKTLDSATGTSLDLFGEMFNIPRLSEEYAQDTTRANIKIYIDPSFNLTASQLVNKIPADVESANIDRVSGAFTITSGLRLGTTKEGIAFRTTSNLTLSGTDTYGFVNAIASSSGASANIATGAINTLNLQTAQPELSDIAKYIYVTNLTPIDNGVYNESDADYRIRLTNAITSAASSNTLALRLAAFSIPGVARVNIINYIDGLGTTGLKITGTEPIVNIGTLRQVKDACEKVLSVGETVRVIQPEYTQYSCDIEVVMYEGTLTSETTDRIKRSIVNYIINLPEGGEVVANRIISLVGIGQDNIKDATITSINVGDFDPLGGRILNSYPVAPGNIKAGSNEKWYTDTSYIGVSNV